MTKHRCMRCPEPPLMTAKTHDKHCQHKRHKTKDALNTLQTIKKTRRAWAECVKSTRSKRNETRTSGNSRHLPSHKTLPLFRYSLQQPHRGFAGECLQIHMLTVHIKTFGRYKGHTITYQLKILPGNASEYAYCCILRYLLRRIWNWILIEHTTSNDFQNRTTYTIKHHIAKAADKRT